MTWVEEMGGSVYYDYESKTPTATKLVERLITKDKVDILIGPFGSGATKAVAAIAERYKIPIIAPTASSEAVYDQGYKHLFGLLAPNGFLPTGFFETVSNLDPKPKSMAFVTRNDFFPKAITNMGAPATSTVWPIRSMASTKI